MAYSYVLSGQSWNKPVVTWYAKANIGGYIVELRQAFDDWDAEIALDFQEVASEAAADIVVEFQNTGQPWDGLWTGTFDGAGNFISGTITFDSADSWNASKFYVVALHELGHGLGLDHPADPDVLMAPLVTVSGLTSWDIHGAQLIYGPESPSATFSNGPDVVQLPATGGTWDAMGGDDIIYGSTAAETIFGNTGDDIILGHQGADTINGGGGDDSLYVEVGVDTSIDGGAGWDALYLWDFSNPGGGYIATTGASIDMAALDVEWVRGSLGNDNIDGSTSPQGVEVYSLDGNDDITGSDFDDILWGGDGDDIIDGGLGKDILVGGDGADILNGGGSATYDDLHLSLGGGDGAADVVEVDPGWGTLYVYNWEDGIDTFDLSALGITFADLTITPFGAHTDITYGGNLIVVVNTNPALIDAGDFDFF